MGTARFQMAPVVAMYQLYFKSTKQKIAAQRYLSSRLIKQPYTECPDTAKSLSDCNLNENKKVYGLKLQHDISTNYHTHTNSKQNITNTQHDYFKGITNTLNVIQKLNSGRSTICFQLIRISQ